MFSRHVSLFSWPSSEIFGSSMFGSAWGDAVNSYQISDGWFANISMIYDPDNTLVSPSIVTNHNAYGYVTSHYNYQVQSYYSLLSPRI